MRDMLNHVHPARAVSPGVAVANNTPIVSQIIDTRGFSALTFLLLFGGLADADVTTTVLVEDGNDPALSDASPVIDDQLLGLETEAAATFADDNKPRKIGYVGDKRYVRLTVTPANNTGDLYLSVIALLGLPALQPTLNPPI